MKNLGLKITFFLLLWGAFACSGNNRDSRLNPFSNSTSSEKSKGTSGDASSETPEDASPSSSSEESHAPDSQAETEAILKKFFAVTPVEEGHFISDLMILDQRPFKPTSGLGLWAVHGFQWKDEDKFPKSGREDKLSLAFDYSGNTECRTDNGGWDSCSQSYQTPSLPEGIHEVHVRVKGGLIVAAARWKIDTKPPVVFAAYDPTLSKYVVMANKTLADIHCTVANAKVDCQGGFASKAGTDVNVQATDLAGNQTKTTLKLQ